MKLHFHGLAIFVAKKGEWSEKFEGLTRQAKDAPMR